MENFVKPDHEKSTAVNVTLTPTQIAFVDREATRIGLKRSQWLKMIITEKINEKAKKDAEKQ